MQVLTMPEYSGFQSQEKPVLFLLKKHHLQVGKRSKQLCRDSIIIRREQWLENQALAMI